MTPAALPADVKARPPGQPSGRIEKRPGDARDYRIDCTPLLREHELVRAVLDVQTSGLTAGPARARHGVYAEVRLSGGTVPAGATHADYPLSLCLQTTQGTVEAVVVVRVHGTVHVA